MSKLIYLVDDDRLILKIYQHILSKAGIISKEDSKYDAPHFMNGSEALEAYDRLEKKGELELVVTDLEMPVMNGLELVQKLGEKNYDKGIILITGNAEADDGTVNGVRYRGSFIFHDGIMDMGVDEILGKPVDKVKFLHAIGKHVQW